MPGLMCSLVMPRPTMMKPRKEALTCLASFALLPLRIGGGVSLGPMEGW